MKKLINDPRLVVRESLEGTVDGVDYLALLEDENIVVTRAIGAPEARPVAIISGGGSGHEPAHAGYVGQGLLAAAVAGDVFTSPSVDAILAAILSVAGPAGVVLVVKNYTGDRLNFGLAAEMARERGIPAEIVVVADDVALRDLVPAERRRGIAGTVLVHKVAGAAAARGDSLAQVTALARRAAGSLGTMGIGLGACTVPAAGQPSFTLGEDEIEFGLGIHGEKGVRRATIQPADRIVDEILNSVLADLAQRPAGKPARVALLVNGLGGTAPLELHIVARRALAVLREKGITVARLWVGNFMTALEMPGCSLTVLPVDDELLALLDAPARAVGWQAGATPAAKPARVAGARIAANNYDDVPAGPLATVLKQAAFAAADALSAAEPHLTDLDSQAGDGDLGASMARGADAIRNLPASAFHTPETLLLSLGDAMRRAIAGSSGPFYAAALTRAGRELAGEARPTAAQWQAAFAQAVESIGQIGGAKAGDRTMLDALLPAAHAWDAALAAGAAPQAALQAAAAAAEEGASHSATLKPRLGRASYLGDRAVGVPDGGAVAVSIWLRALANALA